jgi:hypothetical protein
MEDVGISFCHLANCTTILYMLWLFGIYIVIWVTFPRFGMLYREKSGKPGPRRVFCSHCQSSNSKLRKVFVLLQVVDT